MDEDREKVAGNGNEQENLSFDARLREIEQILGQLETGSLPLEKSIQIYERGVSLIKSCNKTLKEMEGKITLMSRDSSGELSEEPFGIEE